MIVSFDDLYIHEETNLDRLFYLKGKYPKLKVNMFAVPNRSRWGWLQSLQNNWIGIYMHGWNHERGELLESSMLECWDREMDNKVFKSPWYEDRQENLDLLKAHGFTVVTYPNELVHPVKQVVLTASDFRGHVWKSEDWDRLEELCQNETNFELL